MKHLFFSALLVAIFFATPCYSQTETPAPDMGRVQKIDGFYIFVRSEPVKPYESLGRVKGGKVVMDNTFTGMLTALIKKAKKEYPNANALLFNAVDGMTECEAVKYKE